MNRSNGFTIIELVVAIVVLGTLAILLFMQKNTLDQAVRDDKRKVAINAMYYNLEKVYFPTNKSYPDHINSGVLKAMDPALFTDPNGLKLGESLSDYRYEPTGCADGKCEGFTLRADLEREADFIKTNDD